MSAPVVPYTTQLITQQTQNEKRSDIFHVLYQPDESVEHIELLREAQKLLQDYAIIKPIHKQDLDRLPKDSRIFIISSPAYNVIDDLRQKFIKTQIYTARCVIEGRKHRGIKIPTRTIGLSLSMADCFVFPTRTCCTDELKKQILKMGGNLVDSIDKPEVNVVIADRADDKYCVRARARKIDIVSKEWVKDSLDISESDEPRHINHDARDTLPDFQLKPFEGLTFKITFDHVGKELRDLICNNGGKIVYGSNVNHIVEESYPPTDDNYGSRAQGAEGNSKQKRPPRVVDVEFLHVCVRLGYYLGIRDYRAHLDATRVKVKQEQFSPPQPIDSFQPDCCTPPQQNPQSTLSSIRSNGYDRINENQSMPPPTLPRPVRAFKSLDMNDIILKALASYDNATQHTQMPSTQMRGIPENDIRFERAPESSQQLYWSDSIPRKHF